VARNAQLHSADGARRWIRPRVAPITSHRMEVLLSFLSLAIGLPLRVMHLFGCNP